MGIACMFPSTWFLLLFILSLWHPSQQQKLRGRKNNRTMSGVGWVSWQGWAALATFAVQNGFAVLIMRWSKVRQAEVYSSQVAVLMQELAVKVN